MARSVDASNLAGAVGRQNLGGAQARRSLTCKPCSTGAHQATGRPKPRFGRVETERAVEPLESTTTATSTSPAPEYGWSLFGARPSTAQSTHGRLCTRPGGEADGTGTERGIRVGFGRRSNPARSEPTRWLNERQAA